MWPHQNPHRDDRSPQGREARDAVVRGASSPPGASTTSRASRVRSFVAITALVATLTFLAAPTPTSAATTVSSSEQIGVSVQGRPIEVGCLGSGEHRVLVVGGLHTGPEAHSSDLALTLARLAWSGDLELPTTARLCVIPTLNPDGLAGGMRTNANGVDLNRNWPALNWRSDAYHPEGGAVSGGREPLSEPETRALWDYILRARPSAVLVLHCCGAVVEANDVANADRLASAYASGSGMQHIASWTAYQVTGQFIDAMDRVGVAAIDVEMAALADIALESHRAGLESLLGLSSPAFSNQVDVVRQSQPAAVIYRVRSGDTLANIAGRYGTTAATLALSNGIARPELIEIGQLITIPR